jgi:hypothetical protein
MSLTLRLLYFKVNFCPATTGAAAFALAFGFPHIAQAISQSAYIQSILTSYPYTVCLVRALQAVFAPLVDLRTAVFTSTDS